MIGSLLAGQTSVLAGMDSVLAAAGRCAPYPGLFITDGASYVAGTEGVLAAASAPPCDAPPSANMLLWFKSDFGLTFDGTNQVTTWLDAGPNHWNVHNKNVFGADVQGPTYVPAHFPNGLPGVLYSDTGPGTAVGALNYFGANVTDPIPTALDAPRTLLAVFMRDNTYGGICFTCRQTGTDYEFGLWNNSPAELYVFVSSAHGTLLDDPNKHVNETILMEWVWNGIAAPTPLQVWINGVAKTYTLSGALQVESGHSGFSVGNVTSVGASRGFSGWIGEEMMYFGTDAATRLGARAYLASKWNITI